MLQDSWVCHTYVHSRSDLTHVTWCALQVTAVVDLVQRRRIKAHHTATHLLQSALKQVLGPDTCQQGSLCDANRLR